MNNQTKEFTENNSDNGFQTDSQICQYYTQNSGGFINPEEDKYKTPPKAKKENELMKERDSDDSKSDKGSCKSKHSSQNSKFWINNNKSIIIKLSKEDKEFMKSNFLPQNKRKTDCLSKGFALRQFDKLSLSQGNKENQMFGKSNKRGIIEGKIVKFNEQDDNCDGFENNEQDELINESLEVPYLDQAQTQKIEEDNYCRNCFFSSLKKLNRCIR